MLLSAPEFVNLRVVLFAAANCPKVINGQIVDTSSYEEYISARLTPRLFAENTFPVWFAELIRLDLIVKVSVAELWRIQ